MRNKESKDTGEDMPIKYDLFVQNIVNAAKRKDEKILQSLLLSGLNLHVIDNKGLNAAMYIGMEYDGETCEFLAQHGARWHDFASGAAYAGKKALTMTILEERVDPSKRNYNTLATYAAMSGNKLDAEYYLGKIQDVSKCDFNNVAAGAAAGGFREDAEYFLGEIHDEGNRNYIRVADSAALKGNQALAEYFLAKIHDASKRDYNKVAAFAAKGGHQALAEYFLSKIDESQRDYNRVAYFAQIGGFYDIASFFDAMAKAQAQRPALIQPQRAATSKGQALTIMPEKLKEVIARAYQEQNLQDELQSPLVVSEHQAAEIPLRALGKRKAQGREFTFHLYEKPSTKSFRHADSATRDDGGDVTEEEQYDAANRHGIG